MPEPYRNSLKDYWSLEELPSFAVWRDGRIRIDIIVNDPWLWHPSLLLFLSGVDADEPIIVEPS